MQLYFEPLISVKSGEQWRGYVLVDLSSKEGVWRFDEGCGHTGHQDYVPSTLAKRVRTTRRTYNLITSAAASGNRKLLDKRMGELLKINIKERTLG